MKLLVVISLKLSGTGTFLSLYPECLSDGPAPRGHSVVTENRELNQGQPGGGNGRCWFKSIVLNLCRINNSTDLMDSVMTMVNNTVSKTEYLLRVDFRCLHNNNNKKEKNVTLRTWIC